MHLQLSKISSRCCKIQNKIRPVVVYREEWVITPVMKMKHMLLIFKRVTFRLI
jgi:hypothetical protein